MAPSDSPGVAVGREIDIPDGWETNGPMIRANCIAAFRDEDFSWFVDLYQDGEWDYMAELRRQIGPEDSFRTESVYRVYFDEDDLEETFEEVFEKYATAQEGES